MTILSLTLPRWSASAFILAGIAASGCGGGSGSSATPTASGTPPAAVLVAGATYQYTGTESVAISYTTPTATNVNSTSTYTYTANQVVNASASGASAPFDVNRVTTYTVTQAPSSGEQLQSATSDTYENQTFAGATETITTTGSKTVTNGIDLSANLRLGGGPYNESNTSTTAYTTAETTAVYPLVTASAITEALARTVGSVTTDANAGGTYGGGGTTNTTYNNDGSYTRTYVAGNNSSQYQQTVNSNGTATSTTTPATGSASTTAVGTPSGTTGSATIPVSVTNNSTGVVTNDTAADWYPGANQAALPLALTTRTVQGPVTLPSTCAFSGTPPAVIEINIVTTNLDTLGSYATSTEQIYNANGTNICHVQTSTTSNYNVTTGAPTSTTTTTIAEILVSSNQTITGIKRR